MFSSFLKSSCKFKNFQSIRYCANDSATKLSKEEIERLAARKLRAASTARTVKQSSPQSSGNSHTQNLIYFTGAIITIGGIAFCINDIRRNRNGYLGKLYYGSPLESAVVWIDSHTVGQIRDVFHPSSDKLLPDFPSPFYGPDIPLGTPAPPLLVLDLERTLISSIYDAKHGWRHAKRPGADKLLEQLRDYYEIVIFSENDKGVILDVMDALDPEGRCHKFGSSEAEIRDGIVIKRLDCMNRDMGRIILIDDSTDTAEIYPRNTLKIKPYDNINDTNDTALLELIPLLQALVHEGVQDYRECFDLLGTHDAHQAALEYKMRIVKAKSQEYQRRHRGLGALIRGDRPRKGGKEEDDDSMASSHGVPTPAQIVGASPSQSSLTQLTREKGKLDKQSATGNSPPVKKKGVMFSWLEESEKKKQEYEQAKLEQMNQIHQKRMADKQLKEYREKVERDEKKRLQEQNM